LPESRWAIEGAGGLGAPLATRLLADGLAVADVPAKLAARVRALSTGHGRKTDEADALSVAVAAWTAPALTSVQFDEVAMALRALTEYRDDLVKTRTQTVNRLHVLLAHLIPGGAPRELTADTAAGLLRRVRPRDVLGATRRRLAAELIDEVRRLDGRITGDRCADHDRGARVRDDADGVVRDRWAAGREDPGPSRVDPPVRLGGGVRVLHRHRTHRGVHRRRRAASAVPGGGPAAELCAARHGGHPDPARHDRPGLLPTQTRSR
jgi:hypothetical protein